MHAVLLTSALSENVPSGQEMHSTPPGAANSPSPQEWQLVSEYEPVLEVVPIGQSSHASSASLEYFPAGQELHWSELVAPEIVIIEPGSQDPHPLLSSREYFPGMHVMQDCSLTAPTTLENLPASH
jgi:hypothetical protein